MKLLVDQRARYRFAALLLVLGIALDLTPGPEWLSWSFRLAGIAILAGTLILEAWKIHDSRRKLLDVATHRRR